MHTRAHIEIVVYLSERICRCLL